jgi:hypothetical protein
MNVFDYLKTVSVAFLDSLQTKTFMGRSCKLPEPGWGYYGLISRRFPEISVVDLTTGLGLGVTTQIYSQKFEAL